MAMRPLESTEGGKHRAALSVIYRGFYALLSGDVWGPRTSAPHTHARAHTHTNTPRTTHHHHHLHRHHHHRHRHHHHATTPFLTLCTLMRMARQKLIGMCTTLLTLCFVMRILRGRRTIRGQMSPRMCIEVAPSCSMIGKGTSAEN